MTKNFYKLIFYKKNQKVKMVRKSRKKNFSKKQKKSKKCRETKKNPFISFCWNSKQGEKYREKFAKEFDKTYDEADGNYFLKKNSYIIQEMAKIWKKVKKN